MEQNNQFIKSDTGSKKKSVLLIISILIIIGFSAIYFLFLKKEDSSSLPVENKKEVKIDKELDTDQDGLPDYMETILGTDKNNSDTDGDNYSDFDEIKNSYNPLNDKKFTEEEWEVLKDIIKGKDEEIFREMFESSIVNPNNAGVNDFVCGTSVVKDIDGNVYNTVSIRDQCWMKENLKVTKNPAGDAITRYCYNDDPNICNTNGGLYDWNTAMNKSTQEGAQGICPNDWHIPKDSEWYDLENYLKDDRQACDANRNGTMDCDTAGEKLKQSGPNSFDGLLVGYRSTNHLFNYLDSGAAFWSSTESESRVSWSRLLDLSYSTVGRYMSYKEYGFSVRCLKD